MKTLTFIATGLVLLIVAVALALLLLGADRFWRVFGDPDLGPVSFEQLERRASPNDALACPPDLCKAPTDITTASYPAPAADLRTAFAKVIASEPRITAVETNNNTLTDRYIQRTQWLGFPDTVVVKFLDQPDGQSSLAIYSRSQIGHSDMGANKARITRWLTKLSAQIRPVE
ncbi:MAG: DUF1499 domain-containing protein [Pseudomonadota bacterium]